MKDALFNFQKDMFFEILQQRRFLWKLNYEDIKFIRKVLKNELKRRNHEAFFGVFQYLRNRG